ncbi:hypothetical protein DENSPDRAFT_848434 [Dentipellis sp. KUC8613]|nr:hypothetical protein DENSPDRAFT_848434 [Dentipellis sp. KUC8613]
MSMLTCYPYYWSSEEEDMYAELLDSEHKRLGMDSSPKPVRRTHDSDGAPIDPKRYAYSVRRPESEGQDGALQPLLQNRIPIEIFYEILVHLHPRDLLALRKSSNHFRCYTDPCRRSWIWARARANAPVPIPDPPCVSVGKDMWNEEAYASFLFTTENGCNMCGKFTNRLPISFAARIYICDSEICFNTFIDDVTDTPEELIPPEKWMLMQSWMPTLEPELHPPTFGYEVGTPLYSRRGLECSVGEWERSERRSKGAPGDGWVPFSCDAPRTLPKLLSVYSIREELLPHMMKVAANS